MLPASSLRTFISSSSKKPASSECKPKLPTALADTIKGRIAAERTPRSSSPFLCRIRGSLCVSLTTSARISLTATALMPWPSGASSRSERSLSIIFRNPSSAPAEATGFRLISFSSTMHSQANRRPPVSTAMRQASWNNSRRSRTRAMTPLMPLSIAFTRVSRLSRSSFCMCSRANAMSPASSRSSFISSSSKNPTSPAYSASTPTDSSAIISGSMTRERNPRSRASFLNRIRGSCVISSTVIAVRSLTARPAKPRPWASVSTSPNGIKWMYSASVPCHATGFTNIASRSTSPIQAMRNFPASTASPQASLNSSSRSRARTMSALMPLSTAYTRLRRRIFSSASFCSVTSCSVLNQRSGSAATDCPGIGSMTCRMCIHAPSGRCSRYSTSTRVPLTPASMLALRSRSRSSGWSKSSHLRVLSGICEGSTPINEGSVSDQLSKTPSAPVITWPSFAIACARFRPASRSRRRSRAMSSSAWARRRSPRSFASSSARVTATGRRTRLLLST